MKRTETLFVAIALAMLGVALLPIEGATTDDADVIPLTCGDEGQLATVFVTWLDGATGEPTASEAAEHAVQHLPAEFLDGDELVITEIGDELFRGTSQDLEVHIQLIRLGDGYGIEALDICYTGTLRESPTVPEEFEVPHAEEEDTDG